jgi:hypothetical protein
MVNLYMDEQNIFPTWPTAMVFRDHLPNYSVKPGASLLASGNFAF